MADDRLRDAVEEAIRAILDNATVDGPIAMDKPTHVIGGPGAMDYEPPRGEAPPKITMRPESPSITVTDGGFVARVRIIKRICEESKYAEKLSEKSVGQYLDTIVRNKMLDDSKRSVNDMASDLFRLLEQLEQQWTVFVPLHNAVLPEAISPYRCGEFELRVQTSATRAELRGRIRRIVLSMKNEMAVKETLEMRVWSVIESVQPALWFFVDVSAGDKEMAFEKGTQRARLVADLLQLPPPFCLSRKRRSWVGVAGEIFQGNQLAVVFRDKGCDVRTQASGFLMPAEYDEALWNMWQEEAAGLWEAAGRSPEDRTDMQRRCLEAVSWVSRSARAIADEEKIIDCAIACELLLQPKSWKGGLTHAAAEGAAVLLGSSPDERQQIERVVERLFELRGNIIHGRSPKVDRAEAEEFYWIAFRALIATAQRLAEWEKHEDFLACIRKERWHGPRQERNA